MSTIELTDPPGSGQFVAVWEFKEKLWSGTYIAQNGEYLEYNTDTDEFDDPDTGRSPWESNPGIARFFVTSMSCRKGFPTGGQG